MDFLTYFRVIPLFGVLLIVYIILAVSGVDFSDTATGVFSIPLLSGGTWSPRSSELFVIVGLVALYMEVLKATKTGTNSILEHVFSTLVFALYLVLFLTWKTAGSSTFLILALMALFDVIAGFTISIVAARRDLNMMGNNSN